MSSVNFKVSSQIGHLTGLSHTLKNLIDASLEEEKNRSLKIESLKTFEPSIDTDMVKNISKLESIKTFSRMIPSNGRIQTIKTTHMRTYELFYKKPTLIPRFFKTDSENQTISHYLVNRNATNNFTAIKVREGDLVLTEFVTNYDILKEKMEGKYSVFFTPYWTTSLVTGIPGGYNCGKVNSVHVITGDHSTTVTSQSIITDYQATLGIISFGLFILTNSEILLKKITMKCTVFSDATEVVQGLGPKTIEDF